MPESGAEVIEGSQISWKSQESLGHPVEEIPKDEVTSMSQAQIYTDSIGWGWGYLSICFIMKLNLKEKDFPGGSEGKASAYNVGDPGSISGSGRSPGEGNGNPLQYSCLANSMDGGAW